MPEKAESCDSLDGTECLDDAGWCSMFPGLCCHFCDNVDCILRCIDADRKDWSWDDTEEH